MITTVCFVDNVYKSFQEIHRVLKNNGHIVIGFVDKDSPIGKRYLEHQKESLFYKEATFFGTEELYEILSKTGFEILETYQTVFGQIDKINEVQEVLKNYGHGSFIVIKAIKKSITL